MATQQTPIVRFPRNVSAYAGPSNPQTPKPTVTDFTVTVTPT